MLHFLSHWARAFEVSLHNFAVHLRVLTNHANTRVRVVLADATDVPGSGVLNPMWAGFEVVGPGPDLRGLCSWAALLCGCVS